MPNKLIEGVYAALLTPRLDNGRLDAAAFRRLLEFLLIRGIRGFVVNGATGEFCLTTPDELKCLTAILKETIGPQSRFICGIGTTSLYLSTALANMVAEDGATAVLLPPPSFFPYQQQDIECFLSTVADNVTLPLLLYNLPDFTTAIETETAIRLLQHHPRIAGIKDSSGSLALLQAVTERAPNACRIIGNDAALISASANGLCDAVISGIAGVLPEVTLGVFHQSADWQQCCQDLNEVLASIGDLPVPWGLKWIAEARGIAPAHFPQGLTASRRQQGVALRQRFERWT